jgi:hypothetical protein
MALEEHSSDACNWVQLNNNESPSMPFSDHNIIRAISNGPMTLVGRAMSKTKETAGPTYLILLVAFFKTSLPRCTAPQATATAAADLKACLRK